MDKKTTELQQGSGQQMFKVIPSAPQEELVTGMNPQPLTITGVSSSSDGPARMLNLEQSFAPGGATLAVRRRVAQGQSYFRGHGIDIGGGHDCIDRYAALLGFATCRNWDRPDGDAQYLAGVADESYDFLHSSHCLEHMVTPAVALGNWVRVVRPGGHIVVTVPDEEMYEHLRWPSNYNSDHKWSFTIYRSQPRLPKSLNVMDLLATVSHSVEIIKVERIEAGYRDDLGDVDQTGTGTAECAIEFVLRKLASPAPG